MNTLTKSLLTLALAVLAWQNNIFGQTVIYGPEFYDTICSGETYTEHGFDYTPPSIGDFETHLTLPAAGGGDSIVTLHLHVDRTYTKTRRRSICQGGSFNDYGFVIDNPPVGTDTFTNVMTSAAGCDSTIILILTVTPNYNYTIEDYICHGESYDNYNFHYDTPEVGIYEDSVFLSSWFDCDSIVHLKLHVSNNEDTTFYDTICSLSGYHEHGFDINTINPGGHSLSMHYNTTMGCDSIVFLNLFVKSSYNYDIYDTICFGDEYNNYNFHHANLPAGNHTDSIQASTTNGCDSIVRLHINVLNSYYNIFTDTIGLGTVYNQHGFFVYDSVPGWHYDSLEYTTVEGCDSINKLELFIAPTYYIGWFDTLCYGEDYHGHGFDILQPGLGMNVITHNYQTVLGFDSIIKLNLFVNPTYDINIYDTICFGNDYDTLGFYFHLPPPGDHEDSLFLLTQEDCDSLVWLYLKVLDASDTITIIDSVGAGSGYQIGGYTLIHTSPGQYHDTLVFAAASGCDSIVYVDLYVAPQYNNTSHYDTICYGEDYHYYDEEHGLHFDTIQPNPGMCSIIHNFHTTLGYDSIFMVRLYVADTYNYDIVDTICQSEGYHEYGYDISNPAPGDIHESYSGVSIYGCDSIRSLRLHVYPSYIKEYTESICYGENYNAHGFELGILNPGSYTRSHQYTNIHGCDSTIKLNLTVNPSYLYESDSSLCENDNLITHYQQFGYDELIVVDENHIILKDINDTEDGCDSIKVVNITTRPVVTNTIKDTICNGVPYDDHGFHIDDPMAGLNFDTIYATSAEDCDSIALLELYVMPMYDDIYFNAEICQNEVYDEHGFHLENLNAGQHFDTLWLHTAFGCDSVIMLDLYVHPTYDFHFTDTVCFGNGYHEHGFDIDDIDLMPGLNYDTLFRSTTFGCDSTYSLELFVAPVYNINLNENICVGESYHNYNFDTVNPPAGTHVMLQNLTTALGCDSIVTLNLHVGDLYEVSISDSICQGENYNSNGFNIVNPAVGITFDTMYLSSSVGCDSTVMLDLTVSPTYITELRDTICHGEDYHEYGFDVIAPPVGINTLLQENSTTAGCDSSVRMYLYVSPTHDIELYDSICFGESYDSLGFSFANPETGDHNMRLDLSTGLGCDSVVTMHLYVGEIFNTTYRDTICLGEDYYKYNFKIIQPELGSSFHTQSLSTVYGCDSIVNLKLQVANTYFIDVLDSICEGEEYIGYGLFTEELDPGYHDLESRLKTVQGCDSIFYVNLKVINRYETPQIHGDEFVFVSTDMVTGKHKYYVDAIPGCNHYEWSLDNHDWIFMPEHDTCRIIVTTKANAILKVRAANYCSDVEQALMIRADYFDVNELGDISMNIYPNPCRFNVNIESKNIKAVNIISATGITVRKEEFNMEDKVTIDLTNLPSSLYMLEVITSEGRGLKRITVNNN